MSTRDYEFIIRKDSSIPEGRKQAFRRLREVLARFSSIVPDRVNCFLHGLNLGWVLSDVIGLGDAEDLREQVLPPRPDDVIDAIPYGRGVHAPEVEALSDDQVLTDVWFVFWMGIKNDLYFFTRDGKAMPERSVLAWLGFLRGELEGKAISQTDYERLRALLPPVDDDLTPLVAATQ